tara:strand:- start:1107 stop:1475 length:369 start_codon:yes stop_codon:yes gene_type:complete
LEIFAENELQYSLTLKEKNMKETKELAVVVAKLIRQSLESFQDGFDVTDIASFLDEAMDVPVALTGLKAIQGEFVNATPNDIDDIAIEIADILSSEVKNEMLLETIASAIKTILLAYALTTK